MYIMLPDQTSQLIGSVSDRLTKTERRIARAVLEEPTLLAFGTVSDLAARVGTSRPTIVRFATKLGFAGYTELQAFVQRGLSDHLSRPADRIRSGDYGAGGERAEIVAAVEAVFDVVDQGRFKEFSKRIVVADRVWVA
ncbi:MAG: MurR/RpiR family transcriptional regulator, partial [Gemmatimonadetes bacterium]|nr:MurR/RpiR family transcriptional regulator [Gemmatimonadota bacterium]